MRLIDADALIDKLDIMISKSLLADTAVHYALIRELVAEQPTIEADIDRAAIMRLCNEIKMIIVTVCDTGYTLQEGDEEAIMKRTKAIRKELTGDAGSKTD